MIKILKSKQAATPVFTAIMIVVFSLVISVFMYFSYVQIQTTVIRNAMKTGLANLAYTISEDTYTALRESNFEEYVSKLTSESTYKTKLLETYKSDVESAIPLDTAEYSVDGIALDFSCDGKRIRYICTCNVTFYVGLFGQNLPAEVRSVKIEGSHTAKYG